MWERASLPSEITVDDFVTLDWSDAGDEGWRIVADLTCSACGAYQAADSDPIKVKERATQLAVRLFNSVGWRADERNQVLCPSCANKKEQGASQ